MKYANQTEKELFEKFMSHGFIYNDIYYWSDHKNIAILLEYCKKNKIAILALEGFIKHKDGIQPDSIQNNSGWGEDDKHNPRPVKINDKQLWEMYVLATSKRAEDFFSKIETKKNYLVELFLVSQEEYNN